MKDKINKSKKFMIIGISVLVLAIAGATYAYYAASATAELSGYAAGAGMEITVNKLSTAADKDLVPLTNTPEMLTKAAKGNGNIGNTFDASKSCIDKNGNTACQVYEITVSNTSTVPLTLNGGVSLSGVNTPNIDCAVMDSNISVTNNRTCIGSKTLKNSTELAAGASDTYYIIVYINNTGEIQTDNGKFSGVIRFTSTDGRRLKANFGESPSINQNAAEYITNLYENNISNTVRPARTANKVTENSYATFLTNDLYQYESTLLAMLKEYHYAESVNLMNDRLGGTTDSFNGGNIRYYGANPNNYVDIGDKYETDAEIGNWENLAPGFFTTSEECLTFMNSGNIEWSEEEWIDEYGMTFNQFCSTTKISAGTPILWRIVGVFDGRLKLVRDESIGNYSWDTSAPNVNYGHGINQWGPSGDYEGADLMRLLNPGYTGINGSLYWNSKNGTCYNNYNNATTPCNFINTGLSDDVKSMIEEVTWNIGVVETRNYPEMVYCTEREINDTITMKTIWTGKVGLLYLSDYGYATDFRICFDSLNNYDREECYNNNWLYKQGLYYWLLTPSPYDDSGWSVSDDGSVDNDDHVKFDYGVRPSIHLHSEAIIESGNGTKDNPYQVW